MTNDQTGDQIPQDIVDKIRAHFENDVNKWSQITQFLSVDNNQIAKRYLQVLTFVSNNDVAFNKILDTLYRDITIPINDQPYLDFMTDIWNNCLKSNENRNVGVNGQRFDFRLILSNSLTKTTAIFNVILTLFILDSTVQNEVIQLIIKIAETTVGTSLALTLDNNFKNLLQLTKSTSTNLVSTGLVAVFLFTETVTHLQLWRGEKKTSGTRCSKNIIDSFVGIVVGVGGGIVGATAGSSIVNGFGLRASTPMAMGSIIGAVLGGVTCATAANKISDWLTHKLFNLPKGAAAVENHYNFLGLEYGASNDEINSSFVQLALECHPYQVNRRSQEQGIEQQEQSNENWQNLANSMNNIKLSKGEF